MSIKFNSSGFLVQAKSFNTYNNFQGLHGQDVWPLDTTKDKFNEFKKYLDSNVYLEWFIDNRSDLCDDFSFVKNYYQACIDVGIDTNILFCMASREKPDVDASQIEEIINQAVFVGYEYAYSGQDYYSAVFEDVYSKRITELEDMELNQYGLFDTEEAIINFVNRRDELIKTSSNPSTEFEGGNFCFYKVWIVETNQMRTAKKPRSFSSKYLS